MTTMSIPPTQGKPTNGRGAQWRLDAELLRSTLARLCERPVSGAIWPPTLLAFETGLPITEVELALDPGRQRDRASKPELAAWSVYEQLLYVCCSPVITTARSARRHMSGSLSTCGSVSLRRATSPPSSARRTSWPLWRR